MRPKDPPAPLDWDADDRVKRSRRILRSKRSRAVTQNDAALAVLRVSAPPWPPSRSIALLSLILISAASLACRAPDTAGPDEHVFRGETMGTTYVVKVVATLGDGERPKVARRIAAELDRIDGLMSHYRDDSELSRFNRHESTEPFHVSAETYAVFEEAARVSRATGGALDVTIAPLVDAWGFGPAAAGALPTVSRIAGLLRRVGYEKIELDAELRTVRKRHPSVTADLSAVAKGYGADRVAVALRSLGHERFMIEVGGEVVAAGANGSGVAWRIAIERPIPGPRSFQSVIALHDRALATSGDYRNYREVEGVRVAHTIDPRTGRPLSHRLASVSVVAPTGVRADALATGLLVLGPEAGFDLAELRGIAAMLVVADGRGGFEERRTSGFEALREGAK